MSVTRVNYFGAALRLPKPLNAYSIWENLFNYDTFKILGGMDSESHPDVFSQYLVSDSDNAKDMCFSDDSYNPAVHELTICTHEYMRNLFFETHRDDLRKIMEASGGAIHLSIHDIPIINTTYYS